MKRQSFFFCIFTLLQNLSRYLCFGIPLANASLQSELFFSCREVMQHRQHHRCGTRKEKTTTNPPVDATHDDMSTVATTALSSVAEASSSKILQNPIRRR